MAGFSSGSRTYTLTCSNSNGATSQVVTVEIAYIIDPPLDSTMMSMTNGSLAGTLVTQRSTYAIAGQTIAVRVNGDPDNTKNGLFYMYSDHLGSTSAIQKDGSTEVEQSRYLPFGGWRGDKPDNLPGNRGYTGHVMNNLGGGADDLGLIYMNARYYVPTLNRFLSADTIVPDPTTPQSFNRYSYVLNNPLRYIDPSGHFTEEAIKNYLEEHYMDDAQYMFEMWKSDQEWWSMLRNAVEGDVLFGAYSLFSAGAEGHFSFTFTGVGDSVLAGIVSMDLYRNYQDSPLSDISLAKLQQGEYRVQDQHSLTGKRIVRTRWGGRLRFLENGDPFIFAREINWNNTYMYTEGMVKRDNFIWGITTGALITAVAPELGIPKTAATVLGLVTGSAVSAYGPDIWTQNGRMAGDLYIDVGTNQFVIRPGLKNEILKFD